MGAWSNPLRTAAAKATVAEDERRAAVGKGTNGSKKAHDSLSEMKGGGTTVSKKGAGEATIENVGVDSTSSTEKASAAASIIASTMATGTTATMSEAMSKKPLALEEHNHMRDTFLQLIQSLIGQNIEVTMNDGSILFGVFHTFSPWTASEVDQRYANRMVMKAVTVTRAGCENSDLAPGSTAVIPAAKIVHLRIAAVRVEQTRPLPGANAGELLTDADISKTSKQKSTADLVAAPDAWTTTPGAAVGGLEEGLAQSSIGAWDQFDANARRFNVRSTFDENLYTTRLDTSKLSAEQRADAERKERAILNEKVTNVHMMEERGLKVEGDYDEEDLYSGVLRTGDGDAQPYRPPHARSATEGPPTPVPTPTLAPKSPVASTSVPAVSLAPASPEKPAKSAPASVKVSTPAPVQDDALIDVSKIDLNVSEPAEKEKPAQDQEAVKPEETETPKLAAPLPPANETAPSAEPKKSAAKPKLNANAKSFTFNPTARTFTPGGAAPPAATQSPSPPAVSAQAVAVPAPQQVPMHPGMPPIMPVHMGQVQHMSPQPMPPVSGAVGDMGEFDYVYGGQEMQQGINVPYHTGHYQYSGPMIRPSMNMQPPMMQMVPMHYMYNGRPVSNMAGHPQNQGYFPNVNMQYQPFVGGGGGGGGMRPHMHDMDDDSNRSGRGGRQGGGRGRGGKSRKGNGRGGVGNGGRGGFGNPHGGGGYHHHEGGQRSGTQSDASVRSVGGGDKGEDAGPNTSNET